MTIPTSQQVNNHMSFASLMNFGKVDWVTGACQEGCKQCQKRNEEWIWVGLSALAE